MSLIVCPECGKEMSDAAISCPNCGKPNTVITQNKPNLNADITKNKRQTGFWLVSGIFFLPIIFSWFSLKKGYSTKLRVIAFLWLVLYLAYWSGFPHKPSDTSKIGYDYVKETSTVSDGAIEVEGNSFYNEYMANPIKADEHYKGKLIKLTGRVDKIDREIFGEPYVTMAIDNFKDIRLTFKKSEEAKVANLSKGESITVVGKCQGKLMTSVALNDCLLNP